MKTATRTRAASERGASPLDDVAFVGREREILELCAAIDRTRTLAILEGPAGIGKTRLIREVGSRCAEAPFLAVGRCHNLLKPFPLGPVIDALRSCDMLPNVDRFGPSTGALAPLLPELAERLPPAPPPLGDVHAERHRLFRGIVDFLQACGNPVLVVEDIQWIDDVSVEFLAFAISGAASGPRVILTLRTGDGKLPRATTSLLAGIPSDVQATRVTLGPLAKEEVGQLVAAWFDVPSVSQDFPAYLHERTAGIPFALRELLFLMRDRKDIVKRSGQWVRREIQGLRVPDGVRDIVLAGMEALSDSATLVARAAAVADAPMDVEGLCVVAALDSSSVADGVSALLQRGVLEEGRGDRVVFRHDLARAAVYDDIPLAERRSFHLRLAQLLETRPSPSAVTLAHHWRQAARLDQWLRYAEMAAEQAQQQADFPTAYEILTELVRDPRVPQDVRRRALLPMLDAARHSSAAHEAIAEAAPWVQAVGDSEFTGGLHLRLARLHSDVDAIEEMTDHARRAAALLEDPDELAYACTVLAAPWWGGTTVDEHREWRDRARALHGAVQDPALRSWLQAVDVVLDLAVGKPVVPGCLVNVGDPVFASPAARRGLGTGYFVTAGGALAAGQVRLAKKLIVSAAELAATLDHWDLGECIESWHVLIDFAGGHWEDLLARCDALQGRVEAEIARGQWLAATGDLEASEATLLSVVGRLSDASPVHVSILARAALANVLVAKERYEDAVLQTSHGLRLVREKGAWAWACDLIVPAVRALIAQGRLESAAELLETASRGAGFSCGPSTEAAIRHGRGLLKRAQGLVDGAIADMEHAARGWRGQGRERVALLAEEDAGWAAETREGFDRTLRTVLAAYETAGARGDVLRLKRSMRRSGLPVAEPGTHGRKGVGGELSERERQVLELARFGRTNREIAEALYISPRTVEHHVARALRKLGLSSRRELREQEPFEARVQAG